MIRIAESLAVQPDSPIAAFLASPEGSWEVGLLQDASEAAARLPEIPEVYALRSRLREALDRAVGDA